MEGNIDHYQGEFYQYLLAERNASDATVTSYRTDFREFMTYLSEKRLNIGIEKITTPVLRRYFNQLKSNRGFSTSTIRRKIHSMSSYMKFLLEMEYIEKNPMLPIHAPKSEERLPIYLKKPELEKLLKAPEKYARFPHHILRDKTMLSLLVYTGARKSEIMGLNWEDVDFLNATIIVHKGKGKKERIIPLLPPLGLVLLDYFNERKPNAVEPVLLSDRNARLSSSDFQNLFRRYIQKCGLGGKGYTPHKCRHSFATLIVQQQEQETGSADLAGVAAILGHADLNTTKIYTHTATEHLRDVMKKFPVYSNDITNVKNKR